MQSILLVHNCIGTATTHEKRKTPIQKDEYKLHMPFLVLILILL